MWVLTNALNCAITTTIRIQNFTPPIPFCCPFTVTPLPQSSVVIQSLSHVWLFDPMNCSMPGFSVLHYLLELLKLMSNVSMMPCNHHTLCHPFLILPSIFPIIRVFYSESALNIRRSKYWSFSFGISPSSEYAGLISFRIDWFDLAVQKTLKSLLQHHNSKAWILWGSAFFMVQLSHPYMTTGKTMALTIQTIVSKATPLLFNTLPRFVIAFLPRSKRLQWCPTLCYTTDYSLEIKRQLNSLEEKLWQT